MAEFCVDCWNKLHGKDYSPYEFDLTWRKELCEGCGEYKRIIVGRSRFYWDYRFILVEALIILFRIIVDVIISLLPPYTPPKDPHEKDNDN